MDKTKRESGLRGIAKIAIMVVLLVAVSACIADNSKTNTGQTSDVLLSNLKAEREEPFVERNFDPTLDGKWIGRAISYGAYRKGQAPGQKGPSKEEILEDLQIITDHWNLIRVYNADDDTERILEVIKENDLPVRMMMGVWLAREDDDVVRQMNRANLLRAVQLAERFPEIIAAINVGNETQVFWTWHKMDRTRLIDYIRYIRANTNEPVTTADDYNFWNKPESNVVADEIDFIVTHIYPLWNGKTLDNAIPWLDENFKDVKSKHPDKYLVLGEIGWATDYNADKKGDGEQGSLIKGNVGYEAQGIFLSQLTDWIDKNKVTTFYFEAFDEPWKGGGSATGSKEIEKNWGLFYEDRTPKKSLVNFLNNKKKEKLNSEEER